MSQLKSYTAAICAALVLLVALPGTGRAAPFQADYLVSFLPPNPCGDTCSFADYTLSGLASLYFQQSPASDRVLLGRTSFTEVALNETRGGSLNFDLDLFDGPGQLWLTFGGDLVGKNPGPPTMPLYAFELNPGPPSSDPGSAPFIDLGVIDIGVNPGPPNMPLYAFGSVHEVGTLSLTVTPIPEPEIYAMMGLGLGVMGWAARRRKQKEAATA